MNLHNRKQKLNASTSAALRKSVGGYLHTFRDTIEQNVREETGSEEPSVLAGAVTSVMSLYDGRRPSYQRANAAALTSDGTHRNGLPHGVTRWPEFESRPQQFLLAVRLSEVSGGDPEGALPPRGWLNFFMAPEVMTGAAPLTACAVVFTLDEKAPMLAAPAGHLTSPAQMLGSMGTFHYIPQPHEFATPGEYETAMAERRVLQTRAPALTEDRWNSHSTEDYLLGKQWYANPLHLRTDRDVAAFAREQHRRDDTRLQSLLTLTRLNEGWPFFEDNRVLSVTFFIEPSDLKIRRFDRVIVDVTSL
ncbi:DUF1963 domain-containing protein [Deinococcus sp. A31D244]